MDTLIGIIALVFGAWWVWESSKILDKRYSSQWESYNYVAVMDGNLVSFMNKFPYDVDRMLRVKGKVKAQTKNKLFSANETRLNYVKLYKV